jgi:transcriptional regulator with XRE-family HTH domain
MGGQKARDTAEARRRVAALRAQGLTFAVIARRLGLTTEAARSLVRPRRLPSPHAAVRCGACGQEVARRPGGGRLPRAGPLCLACLAQRPDVPFPQRLLAYRTAAGLTQAALGERAGLSAKAVSQAERGLVRPDAETVRRLAEVLGPDLLGGAGAGEE